MGSHLQGQQWKICYVLERCLARRCAFEDTIPYLI
uniref:Uncharacterized protein n=1 Tax=Arundo donax TaxID=35708 RepID=A0A0A9BJS1_ARUDO